MTVKRVDLTITTGRVLLDLSQPVVEFPSGNGQMLPESVASGGTAFQYHRRMRANCYVADALPTENGYTSVGYTPATSTLLSRYVPDRAAWLTSCAGVERLIRYSSVSIVGLPHTASLGHLLWYASGDVFDTSLTLMKVVGLQTAGVTGVIGVSNRIVCHDGKWLYWSGSLNPLDFTPSLHTGAGSTGVTSDIGQIVSLVPSVDGFYILGRRGGLFAKCTGNIQTPFAVSVIDEFSGIESADWCIQSYVAATYMCYTNTGLCRLTPQKAEYDYFDYSSCLESGRMIVLHGIDCAWGEGFVDAAEYIDSPECEPTYMYHEVETARKLKVYSVSPDYECISFGWSDGHQAYQRLLVFNKVLQRSTVLHTSHNHVVDTPQGVKAEFTVLADDGEVYSVSQSGLNVAQLIYHQLQRFTPDTICISKLVLAGRFNQQLYAADCSGVLTKVQAQQGIDIQDSSYNKMDLTRAVTREVQYAGRLRQRVCSLVIPFSGTLSGVTLEYA